MLEFKVVLPAPGASDVVRRELSVQIGEGAPDVRELAADALESLAYAGNDNDRVIAILVDVDDAGNRSEQRTHEATLVDNLAPPQPGELAIQVTAEV